MEAVGETSEGHPEQEVTLHLLLFVVFLFLKDQPAREPRMLWDTQSSIPSLLQGFP